MAFSWKNFKNWATGEEDIDKAKKGVSEAKANANSLLEEAKNINTKSATEYAQEGRSAAGVAASDKAGTAKKEARAASAMAGGNRLQNAIAGAKAASNASSQGYTETANQMAQTQAQLDAQKAQRETDLAKTQAQNELDAAKVNLQTAENKADRKANKRASVLSAVGSIFSDGNVKEFKKHSYIKPEDRIKREGK